uniref:NADH-ubiquinone oxidoreductase chain 6 n=1 Tax=Staphylinidae sp. BMNH 1274216 TaxID=1796559 RepID=A0A140EGU5_9COLE|nr:NADH dehydrogenase subunit 6 [Staphylinidae sp. BMNH 1274216]
MTFFLFMNLSLSLIMLLMNHPLSMGMILLMQTILISLITGLLNMNFWYSYILFLIMIGGMLILFIYMTSIASNEKFKFSPMISLTLMITMFTSILTLFMNYFYWINFNTEMLSSTMLFSISLNKFINNPSNFILFMIIIYLLITLIAVVKITNIKHGPLRQNF